MKKFIIVVMALVLVCSMFTACTTKPETEAAEDQADEQTDAAEETEETTDESQDTQPTMEPLELKFSHAFSSQHVFSAKMQEACDNIAEYTDGAVTFKMFPENQLGSITDVLEQLNSGAPIVEAIGFDQIGDMVPEFAPAAFPYIFQDIYEVYDLAESDWMAAMEPKISANGVTAVAFGALGYRHFISTKSIQSAGDISGMKIRMGPSSAAQGFITVMGGTPTTSTWTDNYSLLQTGVFDSCEADVGSLWAASFQEVCQYLSLTGHFVTPTALVINNDVWDKIPAEYQEYIKTELTAAMVASTDAIMADADTYVQKFRDAGVEVIEPDKASFAAFVPDLFELLEVDTSIYDDIRAAIEENQ